MCFLNPISVTLACPSCLCSRLSSSFRGEVSPPCDWLFTSQQQGSYPHPICSWVTMATGRVASVFFQSPFGNAPLPHWWMQKEVTSDPCTAARRLRSVQHLLLLQQAGGGRHLDLWAGSLVPNLSGWGRRRVVVSSWSLNIPGESAGFLTFTPKPAWRK